MKNIPSPRAYSAHPAGSTLGKVAGTVASLLTIAALLFAGSRDWKSDKPLAFILTDFPTLRSLFHQVEEAGAKTVVKQADIDRASNDVERALIEKGTLIRRSSFVISGEPAAPAGVKRQVASR